MFFRFSEVKNAFLSLHTEGSFNKINKFIFNQKCSRKKLKWTNRSH